MSELRLETRELVCRYPRTKTDALRIDESFQMAPGCLGLVGVNGAGKTTLLSTLAGCRRPQSGQVLLDGVDLYGRHRRQAVARIGYMPQTLNLPGEFRVGDAMAYMSWLRAVPAIGATRRNNDLLDRVGLAHRRRDRVRHLSGGMVRRLTLAMALVTEPDVLLLDEPTTGLDPQQRVVLRDLLIELPTDAAVVVSSHVMEDIERLAQRVTVLSDGAVAYDGELDSFLDERGGPERSAEYAFLSTVTRGGL